MYGLRVIRPREAWGTVRGLRRVQSVLDRLLTPHRIFVAVISSITVQGPPSTENSVVDAYAAADCSVIVTRPFVTLPLTLVSLV